VRHLSAVADESSSGTLITLAQGEVVQIGGALVRVHQAHSKQSGTGEVVQAGGAMSLVRVHQAHSKRPGTEEVVQTGSTQ
jgi:hypothetical protein